VSVCVCRSVGVVDGGVGIVVGYWWSSTTQDTIETAAESNIYEL
jgi:hypothetical protein